MVTFRRSRGSHLEIDSEEQEAPKDVVYPVAVDCHWCQLAWWLSLMTTTIMWSLLTWWSPLQWSQHDAAKLVLVDDVLGALESCWWSHVFDDDVVEPCWCGGAHALDDGCLILWWWWWLSPVDVVEPMHLMMALGPWLELTCYALMTWSHDGDDLALLTWWRWHALMWWLLDEFRPCWGWHDLLIGWHDIHFGDLLLLVMRYHLPFHLTYLALALPILANPCKTLIHPS